MLIHATCGHLTSRQSTAPFDIVELRDYLSIVDRIKLYPPADRRMQQCHATVVIGRIMYAFSRNHFFNFHGEPSVRMTSEQAIYPYMPSLLMVVITPFLFFDSMTLVRELHTTFIDNMPSTGRWDAFNLKLNGQLQDSNLLATVLLNANVGFLAINSVDVSGRTPIQVASYMSLVASLGSMILGLLVISHNRSIGQSTVLQKVIFLSGVGDTERGLERLAIIYSLPKMLLVWGMVFFFAAFSIDWWIPGDQGSRGVVGFVMLVALLMILYGIIRTRNGGDHWHADIDLELPSPLVHAWNQVMEFIGMRRGRRGPPRASVRR
ncbi:hypothetical protein M405DRAFT_795639 [Rhizopogon salebrosus TDB-379]|nr:hypothetical protein M405DRAFT_795639 [Rhizopogon salebrosus TDB-379]